LNYRRPFFGCMESGKRKRTPVRSPAKRQCQGSNGSPDLRECLPSSRISPPSFQSDLEDRGSPSALSEPDVVNLDRASSPTTADNLPAPELLSGSSSDGIVQCVYMPCKFWEINYVIFCKTFGVEHPEYLAMRSFTRENLPVYKIVFVPRKVGQSRSLELVAIINKVCLRNCYILMP
jgi:hypothetical protein